MTHVPNFRTFANELGLPSCLKMWHKPALFQPTVQVSQATLCQWYWRLARLTIDYAYVINDFQINRQLAAEFPLSTYNDRLKGSFGCNLSDTNEELCVGANFHFPLCQVIEATNSNKPNPAGPYTYPQSALCPYKPLNANQKLGLYARLEETATDGSFTLTNIIRLVSDDLEKRSTVLGTHTCPFMDSQTTFILRTPEPDEIEGKILYVKFTPTFYEV